MLTRRKPPCPDRPDASPAARRLLAAARLQAAADTLLLPWPEIAGGLSHAGHDPDLALRHALPWQRPTDENINGVLRDYFPKGTDPAVHTAEDLAAVQTELNERPRKALNLDSPDHRMAKLLVTPVCVATLTGTHHRHGADKSECHCHRGIADLSSGGIARLLNAMPTLHAKTGEFRAVCQQTQRRAPIRQTGVRRPG